MNAEVRIPPLWETYKIGLSVGEANEQLRDLFNSGVIRDGYVNKNGTIRVQWSESSDDSGQLM